ncbi:MAG: histidine phosphatase family protein [bacterium]|nr:MAG: histidine phosphatase family protein [bacterium]
MREIIIVQHCQSEHHVNNLTGGWTDTPLTDLGYRQAEATAKRIAFLTTNKEFVLYSSDLLRAKQTAEIISYKLGIKITFSKQLREINNGVAVGKTKEWANEHRNVTSGESFSIDYREFDKGESWREFYNRICNFMKIVLEKDEEQILIVSHGCAIGYIIAWWMQFTPLMLEQNCFQSKPGSISILKKNKYKQHSIILFNDTCHLIDCE